MLTTSQYTDEPQSRGIIRDQRDLSDDNGLAHKRSDCHRSSASAHPAGAPLTRARSSHDPQSELRVLDRPVVAQRDLRSKRKSRSKSGALPGRRAGFQYNLSKATFEQLWRAIAKSKCSPRELLMSALVLGLGLRPTDVARLKLSDIILSGGDLELRIARIDAARGLPSGVQDVLKSYLRSVSRDAGPLFVGRFSAPITANAIQQQIRRTAKRHGLALSAFAGRRAQLHDIDFSAACGMAKRHVVATACKTSAESEAIQKVALYLPFVVQPATPHQNDSGSQLVGRPGPRRYR
mgnify:CR=1 FL=1